MFDRARDPRSAVSPKIRTVRSEESRSHIPDVVDDAKPYRTPSS